MARISASSIKTLNTCSFQFYYTYILKGNTFQSPKTVAGTVCHEVLEELSNREKYGDIVSKLLDQKKPNIYSIPELDKITNDSLDKNNLNTQEWRKDVNKLVVGGLSQDFYIDGALEYLPPEYEFWVKEDDLEIRGFIDRAAKMPANELYPEGYILVRDYKSQKDLFTDEELDFNIQAYVYQWALHREYNIPVIVEFVLLRHNTIQRVEWIGDGLLGIIEYIKYIYSYTQDFDIKKAKLNYAARDEDKSWLCAPYCKEKYGFKKDGSPMFACYAKWPTTLYMVIKEDGDIKYSTDKPEDIKDEEWDNVKIMKYGGCPYYFPQNYE